MHMLMGGLRHIIGAGLEQLVCQVVKSSAGRQFVTDLRDIFVVRAKLSDTFPRQLNSIATVKLCMCHGLRPITNTFVDEDADRPAVLVHGIPLQ